MYRDRLRSPGNSGVDSGVEELTAKGQARSNKRMCHEGHLTFVGGERLSRHLGTTAPEGAVIHMDK